MQDISPNADVIDVRDVIERYEQLRAEWSEATGDDADDYVLSGDDLLAGLSQEDAAELEVLTELLADMKGYGGDHQWNGDWYPVTLIRDTYFVEYARELADDIGAVDINAGWPNSCIDWEKAAWELRMDYTSVEYAGITYWYR